MVYILLCVAIYNAGMIMITHGLKFSDVDFWLIILDIIIPFTCMGCVIGGT